MASSSLQLSHCSMPVILLRPSLFSPRRSHDPFRFAPPRASSSDSVSRRQLIGNSFTAVTLSATSVPFLGSVGSARSEEALSEWDRVHLPIDPGVVLLDIAFVPDKPNRGFLLGTRQTIMETKDGGNTWATRSIPSAKDEDFNYRFNAISFKGKEGLIVGKSAILLYTADAGDN